jgi:uncharacterized membrane protein
MLLNTILWIIRSQSKCLAVNVLEIFFLLAGIGLFGGQAVRRSQKQENS